VMAKINFYKQIWKLQMIIKEENFMYKIHKKNKTLKVKYFTKNTKQELHLTIQYMIKILMILHIILITITNV
jgi:hypothetical protein